MGDEDNATGRRIQCELPSGISLEIILTQPSQTHSQKKLAVLLHPWSWLGGSMHDPVLYALSGPLLEKGYYVIQYNSRGCGRSTGRSSFSGTPEAQDLHGLIQWAMDKLDGVVHVVVMGYSHGSLIASLCPPLPSPVKTSYLLLSYPLSPRGLLTFFRSSTYNDALRSLVQNPEINVMILHGDADEFTGISKYEAWTEALMNDVSDDARSSTRIVQIPGGSHFWRGRTGDQMLQAVRDWLP